MSRPEPANRTTYWSNQATPGVSLLRADFRTMNFRPHSHDAYVVAVTETGGSVIRSRGDEFEVKDNLLMVFNPDEPHEGWLGGSERWRYRSLYISKSATDLVAASLGIERIPRFLTNGVADKDLCGEFLRMHQVLQADEDPSLLRESFLNAFCTLFRRHGDHRKSPEDMPADQTLLARAISLMEARYAEKLLLDELSAEIGLTSFQLIVLFKRCTGLTPHTYLIQVRLRTACRLLREGTSIAETSFASGFYDQAAMTNQFRRTFAITPMQYARAWAQSRSIHRQ
jgi:AraC-like DNA-binding protein